MKRTLEGAEKTRHKKSRTSQSRCSWRFLFQGDIDAWRYTLRRPVDDTYLRPSIPGVLLVHCMVFQWGRFYCPLPGLPCGDVFKVSFPVLLLGNCLWTAEGCGSCRPLLGPLTSPSRPSEHLWRRQGVQWSPTGRLWCRCWGSLYITASSAACYLQSSSAGLSNLNKCSKKIYSTPSLTMHASHQT